jgi:hypothetical protein
MQKEKIIVARNYNSSNNGGIQNHGIEVSIGYLTGDKTELLKSLLQNESLFKEMKFGFNSFQGSSFLSELMDVNEHYHKQGMITYESELDDDSEELSTDNWEINNDGANNKAAIFIIWCGSYWALIKHCFNKGNYLPILIPLILFGILYVLASLGY